MNGSPREPASKNAALLRPRKIRVISPATRLAKRVSQAGLEAENLELIIVATITPDTLTPATACYVQEQLGAEKAIALDISAACSGFLYALEIARNFISSAGLNNALIIGAEKLSAFVNWKDRNTCVLFGDGAGAAVLVPSNNGDGHIMSTHLGTDGKQTELLNIPGGGSRCPITKENAEDCLATLAMQGREVFRHAVNAMRRAATHATEAAGLSPADIDLVIPHQANLRIIDAIVDRLEISSDDVFVNVDKYGNTSAAAVAIALDEANRQGRIKKGDHVLLVAFGAGLTWASTTIKW